MNKNVSISFYILIIVLIIIILNLSATYVHSPGKIAMWTSVKSKYSQDYTETKQNKLIEERPYNSINVKDPPYNAKCDGSTDDTLAFQTAINAAQSRHTSIFIPSGTCYFALSSPPLDPGVEDLEFAGEGMNTSILKWDEGAGIDTNDSNYKSIFRNTLKQRKGRLIFRNMQFRGSLFDTDGRINTGGPALFLNYYSGISLINTRFQNISNMATQCDTIDEVLVIGSVFDIVMRDMVRFRASFNVRVIGNAFSHSDDDAVALHHSSLRQAIGQIREGIIVEGNTFEDTAGIHIVGARIATVANNILRRNKVHPISIHPSPDEGPNPMFAISVIGNTITDTIGRLAGTQAGGTHAQSAIQVFSQVPRTGATNLESILGQTDRDLGIIIAPYDLNGSNSNIKTHPMPAAYGVNISHNIVMRTLPSVKNYSSWGRGQILSNNGWADPLVSDANLRPTAAIQVSINIVGLKILNNYLANASGGIGFYDTLSSSSASSTVSGNTIFDCTLYGVKYLGRTQRSNVNINFSSNDFNLDPYYLSYGRNESGSWNGKAKVVGIDFSDMFGVIAVDNVFQNLFLPIKTMTSRSFLRDNIVKGIFEGVGYSQNNRGIGNVPQPGGNYWLISLDQNLINSNISNFSSVFAQEQNSMPKLGVYYKGQFIRNSDPAVTAVFGWLRLTNGSSHIAGTDWKVIPLQ